MRRTLLSLLPLVLVAGEARVEAPLRRARLYPDQAWLTREGAFRFTAAGTQRIRIDGLPAGLDLDRLRVQVDGLPGLRLGNVSVVAVEGSFQPDAATRKVQEELKALEPRIADLHLRQSALEKSMASLESLRPQSDGGSSEASVLDPLTMAGFSRAFQARHGVLLGQGLTLAAEAKPLEARAAELRALLERQESEARKRSSAVIMELEAPQAGQARVVLETRTSEARWKPAYEVHLAEDGKTLELLCYAAVSQASGEAWNNIGLEISNAQPSRNLRVPPPPASVQILYEAPDVVSPGSLSGRVMDQQGAPLAGVTLTATCETLKMTRTTVSDANGSFRFALLPAGTYKVRSVKSGFNDMVISTQVESGRAHMVGLRMGSTAAATVEVVAATSSVDITTVQSGATYSLDQLPNGRFAGNLAYLSPAVVSPNVAALEPAATHFEEAGELGRAWFLEGSRTLPSDARSRRMLLSRVVLEATPVLRAVPRVSSEVFSLAQVHPTAGFPWFQGTAVTVFRVGERLGQMPLPARQAGEPVAFSFGPVPGLGVQRTRVEAKVVGAKGTKGRQWTLRERVTLLNALNREVEVEVVEPALRSTTDKVKVEPLAEAQGPTRRTSWGDLVWKLHVPPGEQTKLEEGWRISGPGVGHVPQLPALGLPISD